jgi:hypothetical protein
MVCHRQYVSEPLQAGHVFDTTVDYKSQVQVFESAANDNLADAITIRIVSEDGSTVRHVAFPDANLSGGSGLEWNTALRNEVFANVANCVPIGSYTTVAGDRLVVEFGHGDLAGTLAITGTSRWGSDGTDLPENRTETGTTFIPWFETTLNLTFESAGQTVTVGQASETDTVQPLGIQVGVGQASESDTAGAVTPLERHGMDVAAELDRAHQIAVLGGQLVVSDAPVLIRAPRKAGRIFHEVSRGGDAFHPSIGEWEAVEDAPGGFRSAKGLISSALFEAHRETMREGALWRTFTEDGLCIFAGTLKEPDPEGSMIQLAADGRAHLADREIGPILYQAAVGSELAFFSGKSKKWTAEFTALSHNLTDTGLVFTRDDTGDANPDDGVAAIIPFFGRDVGYLRAHVQGRRAFLSVKTTTRQHSPNILSSAELDVANPYENWFFHFQESVLASGEAAVDLTLGSNDLPNPNSSVFTNDGTPGATGIGFVWPDCIIISCGDNSATTMSDSTEVLLSNIEVNGSALGSSRSYSVGDLVEDIAARLGFREVRAGGSYDVTPYELPPGVPASEALDWACLLTGKRYRILDSGSRATFEWGPWRQHAWGLASPWSPLQTIPMERFDAVVVPFSYPGTHGQLTDTVTVRVEDSPLPRKHVYHDLALSDSAHNRDKAQDLGAQIADDLVRHRFEGDFQAAEVIGPDGEKRSAHHVNAGDILEPWRGDEPGRLRIGVLRRFEDHVEGEFDGENRALNRLLARREKRLEARR